MRIINVCLLLIAIHHFKEAFQIKLQTSDLLTLNISVCISGEQRHLLIYHTVLCIFKFRKCNINKIQLTTRVLLKLQCAVQII